MMSGQIPPAVNQIDGLQFPEEPRPDDRAGEEGLHYSRLVDPRRSGEDRPLPALVNKSLDKGGKRFELEQQDRA